MGPYPPTPSCAFLRQLITQSHALYLYGNAIFLSERLLAIEQSMEALFLVAQSHFLNGSCVRVDHMLNSLFPFKNYVDEPFDKWKWRVVHLWGVACIRIGNWQRAESLFSSQDITGPVQWESFDSSHGNAATEYFLGSVCRSTYRHKSALQHYTASLEKVPFMFCSFEEACEMGNGLEVDPLTIFGAHGPPTPGPPSASPGEYCGSSASASTSPTPYISPSPPPSISISCEAHDHVPAQAPSTNTTVFTPVVVHGLPSEMLLGSGASLKANNTFCPLPSAAVSPPAAPPRVKILGSRPQEGRMARDSSASPEDIGHAEKEVLAMLHRFAEALRAVCTHHHFEATQSLQHLPRDDGWVLSLLGRTFMDSSSYEEACQVFSKLRVVEPWRTEGMVEYSTALYQLKREKELSALARQLDEKDRNSLSTLCVVANCFSLSGDHEKAVSVLKDACKLNRFAHYCHTLRGHELFLMDDIDNALQAYRQALQIHPRHYNAWFGMAQVYAKKQRYENAHYYLVVAIKLNPNSSPLYVHLAMTLKEQGRCEEAMARLQEAIVLRQNNVVARLKKAQLHFEFQQFNDAIHELESLREIAPKEVTVLETLGKCYAAVGDRAKGIQTLNLALDLDPKLNPSIKNWMDRLCEKGPVPMNAVTY